MPKKNVLITGSSNGLGKHLALEFSAKDYDIIIHGRNQSSLEKIKAQIQENKTKCHIIQGDIRSRKVLESLSDSAKQYNLDILVNNLGVYLNEKFENIGLKTYREIMDINFFSAVNLTKKILPIFKAKGSGLIVNINSIAGKEGSNGESAYCASKQALRGFFNSIRQEITKYGIRVIDIYSGAIATQMTAKRKNPELLIQPKEAAEFIVKNCNLYNSLFPKEIDIGRINYE